jgi:hypothetical protein
LILRIRSVDLTVEQSTHHAAEEGARTAATAAIVPAATAAIVAMHMRGRGMIVV